MWRHLFRALGLCLLIGTICLVIDAILYNEPTEMRIAVHFLAPISIVMIFIWDTYLQRNELEFSRRSVKQEENRIEKEFKHTSGLLAEREQKIAEREKKIAEREKEIKVKSAQIELRENKLENTVKKIEEKACNEAKEYIEKRERGIKARLAEIELRKNQFAKAEKNSEEKARAEAKKCIEDAKAKAKRLLSAFEKNMHRLTNGIPTEIKELNDNIELTKSAVADLRKKAEKGIKAAKKKANEMKSQAESELRTTQSLIRLNESREHAIKEDAIRMLEREIQTVSSDERQGALEVSLQRLIDRMRSEPDEVYGKPGSTDSATLEEGTKQLLARKVVPPGKIEIQRNSVI